MHYSIGPYPASKHPAHVGYSLPNGVVGAIDLAPLESQGQLADHRPVGVFCSPDVLPSEYDLLATGDCRELSVDASMLDKFESLIGYRPQGDKLVDCFADCLIGGSDPSGEAGPLPMMPTSRGNLDLHLGGHSLVKRAAFKWGVHPHTNRIKATLQKQFERHLEDAKGGKLKDAEHHRRVLDAWCDKYKLQGENDWKEFVPTKLQREVPGRIKHETTLSDNFNRANSSLDAGSWTEIVGDWSVVSNQASLGTGSTFSIARYQSDLSSDDHYSEAACYTSADAGYTGTMARKDSSSTQNFYASEIQWAENNVTCFKRISGATTNLNLVSLSVTSPGTIRLRCDGSTIETYINGVLRASATDSAVTGNLRCGLWGYNSGGTTTWDDWVAEDLAVAVGGGSIFRGRALGRGRILGGSSLC